MTAQPVQRYHSLDALRAAMMLLGLVLHSAVSYVTAPLGGAWPYQDPNTTAAADLLAFFIHLFRMPVFFVVAGFFGAMLYHRDGLAGMASNRMRRVLLPLVLFWVPLFPLIVAGFVFANGRASGDLDWTPLTSGAFLQQPTLAHLWFLWHLMIFYAAAVVVVPFAERLPRAAAHRFDAFFASVAGSPWGIVVPGGLTAMTLLPMDIRGIDTSGAFLPPLRILVAYSVFFAFGWFVFRRRESLDGIAARWPLSLTIGMTAFVAYSVVLVGRPLAGAPSEHLVGISLASVAMWGLTLGLVGLFIRHLNFQSAPIRYMSDGAYWIYLVHLPLTIWIPGVLAPWPAPAALKFLVVLAITTLMTTATYHVLVRSTAIGVLLNGRRHPRGVRPVTEAARPAGV